MSRGWWHTIKSVKRHAKGGAVQKVLARMHPASRAFCQSCQLDLDKIVLGSVRVISHAQSGAPCSGHHSSLGRGFGHRHYPKGPPKGLFLELCAGTCRLSRAVCSRGFIAESFEITQDPSTDVLSRWVQDRVLSAVKHREVSGIWIGLVCGSFSRASRGKPGGRFPGPVRSDDTVGI